MRHVFAAGSSTQFWCRSAGGDLAGAERPHFAVSDDMEREIREVRAHAREVRARDGDLEIAVRSGLAAEEQVDRPTADDAPRNAHACEPARGLLGTPGIPGLERWTVPAHAQTLRQLHCQSNARTAAALPSDPAPISANAVRSCHGSARSPAPAIGSVRPVPKTAPSSSPSHST